MKLLDGVWNKNKIFDFLTKKLLKMTGPKVETLLCWAQPDQRKELCVFDVSQTLCQTRRHFCRGKFLVMLFLTLENMMMSNSDRVSGEFIQLCGVWAQVWEKWPPVPHRKGVSWVEGPFCLGPRGWGSIVQHCPPGLWDPGNGGLGLGGPGSSSRGVNPPPK